MKKTNAIYKIVGSFFVFILLFAANLWIPLFASIEHTSRMWLTLDLCVTAVSVFLLVKNKLPTKAQMGLSLTLGLLMFVAYRGVNFSSVKGFLTTTLCAMASFAVFRKYPANAVLPIKAKTFKQVLLSLLIGLGVGGVFGVVNLLLSGQSVRFQCNWSVLLTALSPAILEEVCYRLLLFAYCLYLLKGNVTNRIQNFWCYFMMIMPHVLIHTPETFLSYGIVSGVWNVFLLSLIFGLPFALLQRKRDLTSAMIAHGMVDIIRFSFLGLPF